MKSTTSVATIEKLREIFATHGLPKNIVSDNGPNFTSAEFEDFIAKNGIKHTKVRLITPLRMGRRSERFEYLRKEWKRWKEGTCKPNYRGSS